MTAIRVAGMSTSIVIVICPVLPIKSVNFHMVAGGIGSTSGIDKGGSQCISYTIP